jgi:precorrin-2 dehydrogenase/sirohydrochlorin ferrochelatase
MSHASQNPYFQIGLDVAGQSCLIVGGGPEAEDKSGRLLDAGAELVVVSARVTPRLELLADESNLVWRRRSFQMDDLDGVFMVVNTVQDTSLTERIYERACRDRLLINSYDQPTYSNFGMAALVHPGPLRISISTSNASPALASRLRQDLERLFDEEFVEYITQLGRVRQHLRQQITDGSARMDVLKSLVADFRLEGGLHYPENWRAELAGLLDE